MYKVHEETPNEFVRIPNFLIASTPTTIMSSEQYPLRQSGIYRNLPNFDPAIKDLTAIVVGATGISGFNTLRCLLEAPDRWKTIYAVSRSPPPKEMWSLLTAEQQARVKHVSIDLAKPADETSTSLEKAGMHTVDYVFFYGYLNPQGKVGHGSFDGRCAH